MKEKENEIKETYNVEVKYFPDIVFDNNFKEINNNINSDGRNKSKSFQWHKMYLFDVYLKKWNYIFYIDCGINILRPIQPILDSKKKDKLLAHNDAYPTMLGKWKLKMRIRPKA